MSSGQQIIKVLAIIFAVFLIVNIFGWMLFGIATFIGFTEMRDSIGESSNSNTVATAEFSQVYEQPLDSIKIETGISKLTIKKGTELKVEGRNLPKRFSSKVAGTMLIVKEEGSKKLFGNDITSEITITIPEGKTLDSLKINLGIGNNVIEDIEAKSLDLQCGVGVTELNNITVLSKAQIDGGAGKTTIKNSSFNNFDLEAGVGEIVINADITGKSKIECGVGRLELNLLQPEKAYAIKTETGLGRLAINGKKCSDDTVYGNGNNTIKITGGVGAVEITTVED